MTPSRPSTVLKFQVNATWSRQNPSGANNAAAPTSRARNACSNRSSHARTRCTHPPALLEESRSGGCAQPLHH